MVDTHQREGEPMRGLRSLWPYVWAMMVIGLLLMALYGAIVSYLDKSVVRNEHEPAISESPEMFESEFTPLNQDEFVTVSRTITNADGVKEFCTFTMEVQYVGKEGGLEEPAAADGVKLVEKSSNCSPAVQSK